MHRERAAADRPGDDTGEIEHAHTGKRALGRGKFLRRRVADLFDAQHGKLCHSAALRMPIPLRERPAGGDDETRFGRGGLERLGLPVVERALHGGLVMRTAEQFEQAVTMMRQIGVQPRPAAIAAAVETADAVVEIIHRLAVDAQITFAAELDRRAPHIDGNALPAAGAQAPYLRRRQSRRRNRRLRRSADRE